MKQSNLVHLSGNRLVVTSLEISNRFEKRHDDVLKAIKNIECSQHFRHRNFAESSYNNRQNKSQPMYEITRDGFVFLCMGFTGQQAAHWKERYIEAFNAMEQALRAPNVDAIGNHVKALQAELLKNRPRMAKVLKLRGAGFSKRETAKMLGFGETTIRKEMAIIEKCGYHVGPVGTQLDLFGGE
ncbi:MAG: hypothetical protein BVN35_09510 [Proteobacteria bacterium ST_bin11]|nr:MAG: hypothetical protein BVN35_09510 [Proteobacteria bacterium ST_bin11]